MNVFKQFLEAIGFSTTREFLETLLGGAGILACLVLMVYAFEAHPSHELRRGAIVALIILALVLLLFPRRSVFFIAVFAIAGGRSLVYGIAQRDWRGIAFAAGCATAILLIAVFFPEPWRR